ncbi:hypothetical protein TcasGA2_TC001575 [Tribolium castaneum]|uniref:Uncharacterized protein n=2 Tax=Tribolium castaneum TaxID=7070 RepID=D6WFS1_TRICA|nr:hypothetical protein TcasGA2_TC001575 [Tribolium castaneum]
MIFCGRSGKALNNIPIDNCNEINNLHSRDNVLVFGCVRSDFTGNMKITLNDVQKRYGNTSYVILPIKDDFTDDDRNSFIVGNRKLLVNNVGICPNCRASIELIDLNTRKKQTWYYNNASVLSPKLFHFRATKSNLQLFKGHITGFILKIWQWVETNIPDRKLMRSESKRHAYYNSKNASFVTNTVTERVVLITFNESNVHVINASLVEVTQLCVPFYDDYICQPDLHGQENSVLVGDLDQDGSQELISYSSSFVKREDVQDWMLISNITVIRLEAELPKLYEEK